MRLFMAQLHVRCDDAAAEDRQAMRGDFERTGFCGAWEIVEVHDDQHAHVYSASEWQDSSKPHVSELCRPRHEERG
jgi:hypothetical protein